MIRAYGLAKRYGEKTVVRDLTFTARPGTVTGFLGPNGAGKSTTMRMLLGLDAPTSGRSTIGDRAYVSHPAPLRQHGALLEARSIHPGRTARAHLQALAHTHGIPRRQVASVIDRVGLGETADRRVKGFSLGMGQRLCIAAALLADPATVILDELVNGLDPEGVLWIRNLLKSLAAEGRTVFVSSHLMSEMAVTAEHLIIIGRGRLLADTTVEQFVRDAGLGEITVVSPEAKRLRALLARRGSRRRPGHAAGHRRRRRAYRPHRGGTRHTPLRTHPAPRLVGGGFHGADTGRDGVRGPRLWPDRPSAHLHLHPRPAASHRVPRSRHVTGRPSDLATQSQQRQPRQPGQPPQRSAGPPVVAMAGPPVDYRVTWLRVVRSEWANLWSLRSTWSILAATLLVTVSLGAVVAGTYQSGDGDRV